MTHHQYLHLLHQISQLHADIKFDFELTFGFLSFLIIFAAIVSS